MSEHSDMEQLGDNLPVAADNAMLEPAPERKAVIEDVEPRRTHVYGDLLAAGASLLGIAIVIILALYMRGVTSGVENDARNAGNTFNWLLDLPASMLQQLVIVVVVLSVLIQLLVNREWFQSAMSGAALLLGFAGAWAVSWLISTVNNTVLIDQILAAGTSVGNGLLPDFCAALGAFLTVAGPRRTRTAVKWGWNILVGAAIVLIITSWSSVVGVILALLVGRIVGLVMRFIIGTQNTGAWGSQIVSALETIGLDATKLTRRNMDETKPALLPLSLEDDLTEHSRLYDLEANGHTYVVSVLDNQVQMTGYLGQIWQWIKLSGVAVRHDRSARDATHHHMAMLMGLHSLDLETIKPYGVTDIGESSIMVFYNHPRATACDPTALTDDDLVSVMRYIQTAHDRGYTHRQISIDTLARLENGDLFVAGWQNGDFASAPANIALDKVELLALLATLYGTRRTVDIARRVWNNTTLVNLIPFIQKAAVPASTRALPGWDKHLLEHLREEISKTLPEDVAESVEQVTITRFSVRSFVALGLLVVAVVVVFTQLKPEEMITAIKDANIWLALTCLVFSLLAWVGSAITLGGFMDRDKRSIPGLFMSQVAQGFAAVSMPAGIGPAFVNLQFLRHSGYRSTAATAIMSAVWVVQAAVTVVLLLFIGIFTGRNTLSGMIPTNTLILVIAILAIVISVAMMIPPVRKLVVAKLMPIVKSYARSLAETLTQPRELTAGIVGALVLNLATGLGFWAALLAFGYHMNPIETTFVFLLANTLGSAVPTPGGMGAVEAALSVAFTAIGVPSTIAVSATLVYRIAFYWLRIPMGAVAMKWLDKHDLM